MPSSQILPACELCPEVCTGPQDALLPNIPAEEVCLSALKFYEPRSGLGKASSMIEQAISAGSDRQFDEIREVVESVVDEGRLQSQRAAIYQAYLPLFEARALGREISSQEATSSLRTIHKSFPEYRTLLEMTNQDFRHFYGFEVRRDAISNTRSFIQGLAGEATVLYLSLYGASESQGQVLFPSSYREDDPYVEDICVMYKGQLHDSHTYNPADPYSRKTVSVKTQRKPVPSQDSTAVRINLLQQSTAVYRDLCEHNPVWASWTDPTRQLEMSQILDLLMQTDRLDSPYRSLASQFRESLSEKVQIALRQTKS